MSPSERRFYERFDTRLPGEIGWEKNHTPEVSRVKLKNISAGGALMESRRDLTVGEDISLTIYDINNDFGRHLGLRAGRRNSSKMLNISICGRVIRSGRLASDETASDLAIRFTSLLKITSVPVDLDAVAI